MADQGKRVIVAGLDKDYRGAPFEPMPALMAVAEDVTKTLAICVRCGSPANNTQRLVESDERVVVGAQGLYEARCRRCFEPPDHAEPPAGIGPRKPIGDVASRGVFRRIGGKPCRNACGKRRKTAKSSGPSSDLHRLLCERDKSLPISDLDCLRRNSLGLIETGACGRPESFSTPATAFRDLGT